MRRAPPKARAEHYNRLDPVFPGPTADAAATGPAAAEVRSLVTSSARSPAARGGRNQKLTHDDATVGSPPYMSPEQWSNAVTVGPASDLYALGVVAYEALTGRRPFNAATVSDYVDLHCNAAVPPLGDGFSPALDRLFQRALAKRPEHRPRTALELAADLRVASGIGVSQSVDLPRLDEAVRDAWLAHAPQPLAESIAALDGARNAHQAHAAALDLVRNLLRYLFAIALATRAQVHTDRSEPALLELIRAMRRRDLTDDERVRMLRMLVRPLAERRGAHPIPELVDMVVLRADDGADGFDPILSILTANEQTGSEDMVRARLSQLVPLVTQVLRRTAFVLDYVLIVPHNQEPERWTGLRRQIRAVAAVRGGQPDKDHPMLLDRNEHICADLWPLVQSVPPTEGASRELFLFDGRGRNGARLVAVPAGYTHHDPSVWEWVAAKVLSTFDPNPEQPGDDHPPYLGLTPYTTSDAARFVGREWEVDHFLNRLRQRALQIVVGPSGAGKSSFVHAGVLPGLPPSWRALSLRPGAAPLAALAARLTSANLAPAELRALLETAPAKVAQAVSAAAGGSTIVIVIDQLEELFTMCSDQDERVKFAAALAQLSASPEAPIRVIGAIRDDFLMQLDALAPLRTVLSPALVLLGNPSREALVRIVVEPAKRAGYSIDADLANAMVDVVADQPGALALLSFTAARLWELRDRVFRELTRRAYDAMGGVGGALSRHAEDTLAEFPADDQPLVREVFRHLVSAEGTRALITAKDLRQRLASPRADAVIDKLVAARLVALSETDGAAHIEVIHDALFGAWPRLQQWVREDLDGARMREQLRVASRQWARRDRPGGLLWRDEALDDLERWLRRASPVALADEEAAFVEASRREARSARWTRRGLLVVGFAIVATGSAIWYGSRQSRAAEQLAEDRLTELVADRGRLALLDGKYNEALVYLAYAQNRGSPQAAVPWMLSRATEPLLRETRRLTLSNTWMWSTAFSPDQRWIVSTDDHGAALWPADRAADRPTWRLPHDDTVYEAAFTSDSRQVVTAGLDGVVKRWDVSRGQLLDTLSRAADPSLPRDAARNHPAKYHELATATDGRWVAALDNTSHLLDVWSADGHAVASIPVAGETSTLAASADGLRVAVADGPIVSVFDTRTWTRASTLAEPGAVKLSFAPGGGAVAVATPDGDVGLWDPRQGTRLDLLRGIGNTITSLAFSPNGEYLAAGMGGGVVRVWNAKTYRRYTDLRTSRPPAITSVAFDVSSTRLASTSADGTGTVWDLVSQVAVTAFLGNNLLRSVQFDAAGSHVIAASWDGTVRLWDATPQYRQWTTSAVEGDCAQGLVPDSDRRVVAVGCYGGATWVWDTTARRLLARLPIDTRPGAPPVVSADGQQVAIALGDTVATYAVGTDIDGGRLLQTITLPDQVAAVAILQGWLDQRRSMPAGPATESEDSVDGTPRG